MNSDDLFPYFAITVGLITVVIAANSPQGKGQDAALTLGSSLATGGLTAYGLQIRYGGRDGDSILHPWDDNDQDNP
jgi:hypothetical protein